MKPQKETNLLNVFLATTLIVLVIFLIASAIGGYYFQWTWTGFNEYIPQNATTGYQRPKLLWDWLELLIVPIFLAGAALFLNQVEKDRDRVRVEAEKKLAEAKADVEKKLADQKNQSDRELSEQRFSDTILESYLERMSALIFEKNLRDCPPEDPLRDMAKTWTSVTARRLGSQNNQALLAFLQGIELVKLVDYSQDLEHIEPSKVDLRGIDLSFSDFRKVRFAKLFLSNVGCIRSGGG
jgi:hypothetical protein